MTPSFRGRMATMWLGVRPIMRLALSPTARGRPSLRLTATTDGSFRTMPRPRTYTRVLVVPRSTAMSLPSRDEKKLSDMRKCLRPREVSVRGYGPGAESDKPWPHLRARSAQTAWSERREEDANLAGSGIRRIRPVHQVLGDLDGQIPTDGAWGRLPRVGHAHQAPHDGIGLLRPLHDHEHRRRPGDEVHEVAVEGLALVLGVVAPGRGRVDQPQLHGDDA